MHIKLLLLATLLLLSTALAAQHFAWAHSMGSNGRNEGISICVDNSGNVYTTGFFEDSMDFDPGAGTYMLKSAGNLDVFIQKSDASGHFLWARSIGGRSEDVSYSMCLDTAGNAYITGSFSDSVDFDPGPGRYELGAVGDQDIFILKLNASGQFLWAKSFGNTFNDRGNSIETDQPGDLYIAGYFQSSVDFDPGAGEFFLGSAGDQDIFILKLNPSGQFLWARSFGGISDDRCYSLSTDKTGNIYACGFYSNTVDFDPGSGKYTFNAAGREDIFILKLDASGQMLWAKSYGNIHVDAALAISTDKFGNIYTSGIFVGPVDFDPGPDIYNLNSHGNADIFIQKSDASGNFIWAIAMGANAYQDVGSICVDDTGNVYSAGSFQDSMDFDPGPDSFILGVKGRKNAFIHKLDSSGSFRWVKPFRGLSSTSSAIGQSIALDDLGNIYSTGGFKNTIDFDPGTEEYKLSAISPDIFIIKLSNCLPSRRTDSITACNAHTWIDGNTYTLSNKTARYNLINAIGCDSIITLNLTIQTVSDISVDVNGATITAMNSNADYQWLDCDNKYSIIDGETRQSFTASVNGNYAVELRENGCIDTSECVSILNLGTQTFISDIKLSVYPNPATGQLTLTLNKTFKNVQIELLDMTGRVIYSRHYNSLSGTKINLPVAKGIYLLNVRNKSGQSSIRIVKE